MWTEERVDELKTMWLAGKSARECAPVLGVTRNAVIGKVHRLKLPSDNHKRGGGGCPSKLSDDDKAYIVARLASRLTSRRPTQADLAAEFGVSQATISKFWIKARKAA